MSSTRSTTIVGAGDAEGGDERGQHLKAGAFARGDSGHRRDHARPSTASTSKRTRRSSGASSRSSSTSRRSRIDSRDPQGHQKILRELPRRQNFRRAHRARWSSSPSATSPTAILPDKAIDLMDEACVLYGAASTSRSSTKSTTLSRELTPSQQEQEERHRASRKRNRGGLPPARRGRRRRSPRTSGRCDGLSAERDELLAGRSLGRQASSSSGPASPPRASAKTSIKRCSQLEASAEEAHHRAGRGGRRRSRAAIRRSRAGSRPYKQQAGFLHLRRHHRRGQNRAGQGARRRPVRFARNR